ncbi:MAG: hypothetical protein LBN92_05755 [Treponema sp.]|nr:hypothetical protein [Treponema sp.]
MRRNGVNALPLLVFLLLALPAGGEENGVFGDAAIAQKYIIWAEGEISGGRTARALAALERGSDYAASSSDISYLLALLRDREGAGRGAVLAACRQALETDRWDRYTAGEARLLEARALVELRRFREALFVLQSCDPRAADTVYWRLCALKELDERSEFTGRLAGALSSFPRDARFLRVFFDFASRNTPLRNSAETSLMDNCLRRLPALLADDPDLAWLASPFMTDRGLAQTYVAAYRAAGNADRASIPAALRLGLAGGTEAVAELFAAAEPFRIGKNLLLAVWDALPDEAARNAFRQNLSYLTAVIEEDEDRDGVVDGEAVFRGGMIESYCFDADQDRISDWRIYFARGVPDSAAIAVPSAGTPLAPPRGAEGEFALVQWERYPAVLHVELARARYIPRPMDFFYTPLRFAPLVPPSARSPSFMYPLRETPPVLSERNLLASSVLMEKPGAEFKNGMERFELERGIPVKSRTVVNGREAAETEYRLGSPVLSLIDLDLDGRKETRRTWFLQDGELVIRTERDADNDGVYEYSELRNSEGRVLKTWDLDRDGIRETIQGGQ